MKNKAKCLTHPNYRIGKNTMSEFYPTCWFGRLEEKAGRIPGCVIEIMKGGEKKKSSEND